MNPSHIDRIRTTSRRLLGKLYRIVESQEEVATRSLVDNLHKQEVLESLLEWSKPARLPGCESLHYLLATPFRYPPLPWGSRFGTVAESGIFYGSKTVPTVLAEAAFYRLRFYSDMVEPPPNALTSYHNIFSAKYRIPNGIRLQDSAWRDCWTSLADPANYGFCQQLGVQLRGEGVGGIETLSARAIQSGLAAPPLMGAEGINIALFDPDSLLNRPPAQEADVTAETSAEGVTFLVKSADTVKTHPYEAEAFAVGGCLPEPA
ncbi:RES family NAD+ phosphorylase [Microbulbifer sp. TYP-18]|uniref:RES family NAD+ phosphorylase n=1 Tax=Microbulbifer sp. TYP-18 TaxID=3230024 RepID=UPI0034C676AD